MDNASEFAIMLKDFELESDEFALSLDVICLYTSLPHNDSLNYIYPS